MLNNGAKSFQFRPFYDSRVLNTTVRASESSSSSDTALIDADVSDDVVFRETFALQRVDKVRSNSVFDCVFMFMFEMLSEL